MTDTAPTTLLLVDDEATLREAQRAERKARMDQMRAARAAQSPAN